MEIGSELVVFPDGHFETFDSPQMVDLPRGCVIFNHLQTDEILNSKNQVGKANINGTLPNGFSPLTAGELSKYNILDKLSDIPNKLDMGNRVLSDINKNVGTIVNNNRNTTNNSPTINGGIHITCPGVTSDEVMKQIGTELSKTFGNLYVTAYQRSMT